VQVSLDHTLSEPASFDFYNKSLDNYKRFEKLAPLLVSSRIALMESIKGTKVRIVPRTDRQIQSLLDAIDAQDFEFLDTFKHLSQAALLCFVAKKICITDFCTLISYDYLKNHSSYKRFFQKIKVFSTDYRVNPYFEQILDTQIRKILPVTMSAEKTAQKLHQLSVSFLEYLKKFSALNQTLFVFEDPFMDLNFPDSAARFEARKNGEFQIFKAIERTPISIFNTYEDTSHKFRLVPSFGMMQAFLQVCTPFPVTMTPRIGLSSEEQILTNAFCGTRDLCVPVGEVFIPQTIDGYYADGQDAYSHDFYHAIGCSFIPPQHRAAFGILAARLQKEIKSLTLEPFNTIARAVASKFIDMDFLHYFYSAQTGESSYQLCFFESFVEIMENVAGQIAEQTSSTYKQKCKKAADYDWIIVSDEISERIAIIMLKEKKGLVSLVDDFDENLHRSFARYIASKKIDAMHPDKKSLVLKHNLLASLYKQNNL
jgi:hypothetical protein